MVDERRQYDPEMLHGAFARIRDLFKGVKNPVAAKVSLADIEKRAARDFETAYVHLCILALSEYRRRERARRIPIFASNGELEDSAADTAAAFFIRADDLHLFPIVKAVLELFERNPAADDGDSLRWLRQAVSIQASNWLRARMRDGNPPYAAVCVAVDNYIAKSPRYVRESAVVIDRRHPESTSSPEATVETIMRTCGCHGDFPRSPEEAVDVVFDGLAREGTFRNSLRARTLKNAVYALVRHLHSLETPAARSSDPMWDCLRADMERFAERMLEEMERDHARGGLTMEYRRAYLLAGREYLHELIYTGACEASHFELLEPHIPGLTYEFFRKRLRGSFQHFLLKLLTGFQKRYRAD